MLVLNCNITIGSLQFDFVHQLQVDSGWEQFTDTAKITMPANLKLNANELRSIVAPGDKVSISTGYDGQYHELFTGYVVGLSPKTPIEISCEDEMWQLKQSHITDNLVKSTVPALLSKYFGAYTANALPTQLGAQFIIDNASKVKVLQKLREEFGLYSFFRGKTLVVGKVYDPEYARVVRFRFEHNIIDDSLLYKRKDDVRLEVKAVSNLKNGKKLEVRLGDQGGEQRSLNFYELSEAELKAAATRELDRLKYDGYRGDFTAFGIPHVRHGDIVELSHPRETDKAGRYWVDKVSYTYGVGGYRQKIQLGPKA